MPNNRYLMSFTAGSLLTQESMVLAKLYDEQQGWDAVRELVFADNLLQMRTASAARRVFREVSARLDTLTPAQLHLLLSGSHQDQKFLLWLAICKRYRFICEFATDVIREKALRVDFELSYDDYDLFFNSKAEWHPEIDRLSPSTRLKLREVLFRMLREAGLLSNDNAITRVLLSSSLEAAIAEDNPAYFSVFPLTSSPPRSLRP